MSLESHVTIFSSACTAIPLASRLARPPPASQPELQILPTSSSTSSAFFRVKHHAMASAGAALSADTPSADLRSIILRATLDEVSASSASSDIERDCCVICLGDIEEACEARPCQHAHFDYLCLLTWLDQRKSCPLCKVVVTEVRHNFSAKREGWDTYKVPEALASPPPAAQAAPDLRSRSFVPRQRAYRDRPLLRPRPRDWSHRKGEPLRQRRHVYQNRLFSLHVGTRRRTPHYDLTPASFVNNPDLVSRARMFLRRELQVFEFLSSASDEDTRPVAVGSAGGGASNDRRAQRRLANVEFVLEYIISILKTVDTQGSMGQAEALITPFLGREHTQLLLHELRAFLRSPYITLESWDRNVQYLSPSSSRSRRDQQTAEGESSHSIYPSVWRRGDPL